MNSYNSYVFQCKQTASEEFSLGPFRKGTTSLSEKHGTAFAYVTPKKTTLLLFDIASCSRKTLFLH